jgi:hypothetical protein
MNIFTNKTHINDLQHLSKHIWYEKYCVDYFPIIKQDICKKKNRLSKPIKILH